MIGPDGQARRWGEHARSLARDRLLLFGTAWTLIAGILFFLLFPDTDSLVRVFWLFQPPLDLILAVCSWRVHRLATGPIRRFWLVMAGVGTLFTLGDSYQAALTLAHPERSSTTGGSIQTACFSIGLLAVVVAMLVYPHPNRTGRERLAFWLDSATLLVGGAVVAWCFAGSSDNPDILGTLVVAGVSICGTFASVKMMLSGNAPMHKLAAFPMLASAIAMSVGVFLGRFAHTELGPLVYFVRFLPSLLIAAGPRVQEILAHLEPAPFGDRRRKPYSLLPYGSMAMAFGALIVILPYGVDGRLWGVVAGLGLICALVAARQLVAFHDNTALIGRLREHETRLRHQAQFDGLTGLANRTHFHERVADALAAGRPVSVLLIDLDGFKAVNDTMGHAAGDALLVAVGDKLRATVRDEDLPARLGGDEFAVLLPAGETRAELTAERILAAFRTPVDIAGLAVPVNASIGVAGATPTDDVESLLHHADVAMYAAKGSGKGIWKTHVPALA
ncbi:GGDEF domain-containing protein [Actinoplanes sp. TBRC 11911]|uniref:GGDEF domain-containing protein n=1 Tax=Actinoplanes sp. TBRC 11911 TaxID=2729386 RepID=UPI002896D577|nr:GGDEF domain-containing protein [Actinoplanes sp. TBRC 11911]